MLLERERLRVGEDLRVVGGRARSRARRPRAAPAPPACAPCRPRPAPAVDISADLTCARRPAGMPLQRAARPRRRRAASPSTCRRRPRSVEPVVCGGVEERTSSPGAEMSGLRMWPKSVGPADEKLVITPLRPVWISWMPARDADRRLAAVRVEVGAQVRAVEVGDHPGRDRQLDRDRVRLAEAVVDEDDPGRAAESRALRLRDERADAARDERDLAGRASPSAACRAPLFGSVGRAAEVRLDRLAVGADDRRDVDERLVERRPGGRELGAAALWIGIAPSDGGPPTTTERRARRRASSRSPRRRSRRARCRASRPCRGRSRRGRCPRRSPGTTPASDDVVDRLEHRVVRRIGLRAAAREVDDVHPVGDRGLERLDDLRRVGLVAERRRHGEDAVVADPGLRRDAARGPSTAGGRGRPGAVVPSSPAAMPETCVPCGSVGSNALLLDACRAPGRGRRARRSPSASSASCRPSGSRPGTRSRPGSRNGLVESTPVSTTRDLDALALVARRRLRDRSRGSRDGPRSIVARVA